MINSERVIEQTKRWIANVVIGLNLCPFARRVFQEERIRYVVTDAGDEEALRVGLARELSALASAPVGEVETLWGEREAVSRELP